MQRNERNKLKERLLKAKQEVSQLQMQVIIECAHCWDNRGGMVTLLDWLQLQVPSLDGSMSPGGSPSKTVKQLEERIKQLEVRPTLQLQPTTNRLSFSCQLW